MSTVIPIGPYHPILEEPENFLLHVEGERVVDIDVELGYNHRGIELLAEKKTYDQIPFLVERICGICSTSHPIAFCQAVEDCAGIRVPERALYIRTIIAELERLHSHMLWVGLAGHFVGYNTVFMWAWRYREPVLDLFEEITGNRNNYAMLKVGGVRRDIPDEKIPKIENAVNALEPVVDMLTKAVLDDPVLCARLKGVGVLSKEDAVNYCVTGPTARASGLPMDVRRDEPYAAYDKVKWNVIVQNEGDVLAKAVVRLLELKESIKILRQCLKMMPKGEISAEVREIPPGDGIGRAEAPRGEVFHYVRSDGANHPVRLKVRAPSYVNVPSFKASCIGETISDVTITLAAVDPCYSCTERMVVIRREDGSKLNGETLLRLSREKTQNLATSICPAVTSPPGGED
jgi:NADH-quinone oxidoreductase subunit D